MVDGVVEETIDKALAIAMDEPQDPVHIDIPIRVATTEQVNRSVIGRCTPQYGALGDAALCDTLAQINRSKKAIAIALSKTGVTVYPGGERKQVFFVEIIMQSAKIREDTESCFVLPAPKYFACTR